MWAPRRSASVWPAHPIGVMPRSHGSRSVDCMPVAVRISPQHMSKDDYARIIDELEASGLSEPEGRISHAAYGEDEVHMFEVWRSSEDFDAHRESMFAVMQGAGVDGGSVEMHPLHSDVPD